LTKMADFVNAEVTQARDAVTRTRERQRGAISDGIREIFALK